MRISGLSAIYANDFLALMGSLPISYPLITAVPSVGWRMPVSILITEVFPAPFGPAKPTISPALISKETSSTA